MELTKGLNNQSFFQWSFCFPLQDLVWSHNRKTGDSKRLESQTKAQWTMNINNNSSSLPMPVAHSASHLSSTVCFWVHTMQSGCANYNKYYHFMSLGCQVYTSPACIVVKTLVSFISQLSARKQYGSWYWYLIPRRPPDFWLLNDHSKIAKINHCCCVCHDVNKVQQYQAIAVNRFNLLDGICAPSIGKCYAGYKWSFKLVDECFFSSGSNLVENLSVTEISSCPGPVSHWPPTLRGSRLPPPAVWKSTK